MHCSPPLWYFQQLKKYKGFKFRFNFKPELEFGSIAPPWPPCVKSSLVGGSNVARGTQKTNEGLKFKFEFDFGPKLELGSITLPVKLLSMSRVAKQKGGSDAI